MRLLIFVWLLPSLLFALKSQEIKITQHLKTIEISIPTQESYQILNHADSLTLIFSSPLQGESLNQTLQSPFEKLQITQNSSNKAQITIHGNNLALLEKPSEHGILLQISSEIIQIPWSKYIAVMLFLSAIGLGLFVFRKYLRYKTPHHMRYSEVLINPRSKLITLEYEGEKYLIFSNQNGCTLLNHYPKTKDNKDFTDLIKEE